MKVEMRDLRERPLDLAVNCPPETLELENDEDFRFEGPVEGVIHFQLVDHKVLASGRLDANGVGQCVRCLGDARVHVRAHVDVMYEKNEKLNTDDHRFMGSEDDTAAYFDGETIHPEPELREALMLEVPPFPICSENCKGLCPVCGGNRNENECTCGQNPKDEQPWKAALKNIKLQ